MLQKVERYLKRVISQRNRGIIPSLIRFFLLPLSWIYGGATKVRNWCYDHQIFRCYTAPIPLVISVGNIVAGGTGKTPVTLLLAQQFYERYPLAIITRGYRSRAARYSSPLILSHGTGPITSAAEGGDEPYLLARRLPHAMVIVGGNKREASLLASKQGVAVAILDDAMQHRKLARDCEIIVVDVEDLFGHNHYLPRGLLREERAAFSRADLLVLNHVESQQQFDAAREQLLPYTKAPAVGTRGCAVAMRDSSGALVPDLAPKTLVAMFSGIANPHRFRRTLEGEYQLQIVEETIFPDHIGPSFQELETIAASAKQRGALALMCTEKDWVRLSPPFPTSLPLIWVEWGITIVTGEEIWRKTLDAMEQKIVHHRHDFKKT